MPFVLEFVQFLCFLSQPMRLHTMALHQGIGTCLITLCGVMEKKCRVLLLNSNFTCFLSSRFHHCIFALQDGEVPESLLINVAYFCDNGGLSAIREAFQEADPASLPFSIAHHLINIVTQVIMSNLHSMRHKLFMSSIIIYCRKLFSGLTMFPYFNMNIILFVFVSFVFGLASKLSCSTSFHFGGLLSGEYHLIMLWQLYIKS